MKIFQSVVIPGGFGGAFEARREQYITVIDLEGQQAGDFVVFNAGDPAEALSPPHCREALLSIFVKVGDVLVTNQRRSILEIVADTVGVHDGTIPACDPTRYSVEFGVPGHRNCLENMWEALQPHGIDILRIPEPLNLFQNSPVVASGRIGITDPVSPPGGRITFRALMDVFGTLSPCPQDIIPGNGLRPTPMRVLVTDEVPS